MQYSFITEQTCYGLKISLKATLDICSFLIHKCGFEYLMTSRLNQDNLEVDISFSKYVNTICHIQLIITFVEIFWNDAKLLWFQRSS